MGQEKLILVNRKDKVIGTDEKLKIHLKGILHRAFSICIFNSKGELLIQRRALDKYHSGGLWSNTVCSHPRPNESLIKSTHRRLKEEMGFDCNLKKVFKFQYRVVFNNDLIENEIDHVFVGFYDGEININENEISDYKWISIEELKKDIIFNDDKYAVWFKIIINKHLEKIKDLKILQQ